MKPIPDLLVPMELAEKRILDQGEKIYQSIERLQYLRNRFETHQGTGPVKAIQRKRALSSLEVVNRQLAVARDYREGYLHHLANNTPHDLAKMGHSYIAGMEGLREHVIRSFSYDKVQNCYDRRVGETNWKWMIEGLFVPELKSYGK